MNNLTKILAIVGFLVPAVVFAQGGTATKVQGVGTAAQPAGGVMSVDCLSGCGIGSVSFGTVAVTFTPLTSTNLSSTIAVTNTFQSIQASTGTRKGCLIQNVATSDSMWVYFGAIGGATKGKSFILDAVHGSAVSCAVGGLGVLTDQVSITGTAPDAFTANFQ